MNVTVVNHTKKLKILHIDNDMLMQKIVRRILPADKFEIDTATDGKVAFNKLKKNDYQYDLILTEMLLPYFSGSQIISAVNAKSEGRIPIVILSGVNYVHVEESLKVTKENYFQKPVNAGYLAGRLSNIWERCVNGSYLKSAVSNEENTTVYQLSLSENNELELAEVSVNETTVEGNGTLYLNTEMAKSFDENASGELLQNVLKENTENHILNSSPLIGKVIFNNSTNLVPDETIATFADGKSLEGVNVLYINETDKAAAFENGNDIEKTSFQHQAGLHNPVKTLNGGNAEFAEPLNDLVNNLAADNTSLLNISANNFAQQEADAEIEEKIAIGQAIRLKEETPMSTTGISYLFAKIDKQGIIKNENTGTENAMGKRLEDAVAPVAEIAGIGKNSINGFTVSKALNGKENGTGLADKAMPLVPDNNSIAYNGKWW
jgi:DNA-binding response OmpR family regulator